MVSPWGHHSDQDGPQRGAFGEACGTVEPVLPSWAGGLPATFLAKRLGLAAFHVAVSVSQCLWLGPASRQSWAIAQGDDTELQVTALMEENLT